MSPPSVLDGPRAFFAGLRFVVGTPRVWRYALVPALVAMVVIGALAALGVWGGVALAGDLAGHLGDRWRGAAEVLLDVLLGAAALLVSVLVGLSLAQPLSGPALDALAQAVEQSHGLPDRPDSPFWPGLWRGLRVTFTALLLGAPMLVVLGLVDLVVPFAVVVTIPLKLLVTAMMVSWDLFDYPFGLRAMRVRDRLAWMSANLRAVVPFGLLAALALFVPVLGLFLLPVGVAGATELVVRREKDAVSRAG